MINTRIASSGISSGIKSSFPYSRSSNYQQGILTQATSAVMISAGTPIGLLLALTYATDITVSAGVELTFRGERPNSRITSN